ncbi:MAG TPA: amidase [Solirubrobacteraceae bacterium]|nr:amidase [Solirubrobacteraceae bacterium]
MSEELVKASATWMAQAIRRREVSAVELLDAHAARIAERDPRVNALVLPRLREARAEAVEADAAIARGEHLGPLHGVPFTAKDPIAVAGMQAPNGSRVLAGHVSTADAVPMRRLRDAGAILLGKTNVPEFCSHWDTYNELFGATVNPHDVTRSAGGSSGGEAAALASAMTPFGLGSDLGGSIRAPCHFCGLFGLKPGRDTVPWADHHPMVSGPGPRMMGTVGPMARCVDDLELALAVLAPLEPAVGAPTGVAVFEDDGLQPVSAACRAAVRRAAAVLSDGGRDVVEARPPAQAEVRAAFDMVLVSEAATGLLPGVAGREDELSAPIREAVDALSAFVPALGPYLEAFGQLLRMEADADAWLERHGAALCPVAPDVAPPVRGSFGPIDDEPIRPGGKLTLCTYANALGLPAVSVPVMRTEAGLPVGVQLIGRRGHERALLALARELEQALGGWLDPDAT